MSMISGGPGWWLASDGRWYPPETRPGVVPDQLPDPLTLSDLSPPENQYQYSTGAPTQQHAVRDAYPPRPPYATDLNAQQVPNPAYPQHAPSGAYPQQHAYTETGTYPQQHASTETEPHPQHAPNGAYPSQSPYVVEAYPPQQSYAAESYSPEQPQHTAADPFSNHATHQPFPQPPYPTAHQPYSTQSFNGSPSSAAPETQQPESIEMRAPTWIPPAFSSMPPPSGPYPLPEVDSSPGADPSSESNPSSETNPSSDPNPALGKPTATSADQVVQQFLADASANGLFEPLVVPSDDEAKRAAGESAEAARTAAAAAQAAAGAAEHAAEAMHRFTMVRATEAEIGDLLMKCQQFIENTVAEAERHAQQIVASAKAEAEMILADANRRADELNFGGPGGPASTMSSESAQALNATIDGYLRVNNELMQELRMLSGSPASAEPPHGAPAPGSAPLNGTT